MLGGSAAFWSGDSSIFDYNVWEGTMSVSERLWSGAHGLTRPPPLPPPSPPPPPTETAVDTADGGRRAPMADHAHRTALGGSPSMPDWLKHVQPRLAVHACHMKMRGYSVSPYLPSTYTMGGNTHWCLGGSNRGGNLNMTYVPECAPCPADWGWDK